MRERRDEKHGAVVYTFKRTLSVNVAMRGDEAPRVGPGSSVRIQGISRKKSADSGVQADMMGSAMTAIVSSIVGRVHTCVTGSQCREWKTA